MESRAMLADFDQSTSQNTGVTQPSNSPTTSHSPTISLAGTQKHSKIVSDQEVVSVIDFPAFELSNFGGNISSTGDSSVEQKEDLSDGGHASEHTKSPKVKRSWWSDWWLSEVLALAFGLGCLIVIIVTLHSAQGQPLSGWTFLTDDYLTQRHVSITPNSLISIFSILARSAIMFSVAECISQMKWLHIRKGRRALIDLQFFDNASRGPLGAIRLLFNGKTVKSVASLCALITIVALAVDPFTQLTLTYPTIQVPIANSSASIGVALIYDLDPYAEFDNVDPSMQAAIYNGIYGSSNFTAICPTGDCVWPLPVTSLGVCHSCMDVTRSTSVKCDPPATTAVTNTSGIISDPSFECVLTTPSGSTITLPAGLDESGNSVSLSNLNITVSYEVPQQWSLIARMASFISPNDTGFAFATNASTAALDYTVSECNVSWCLKTYNDVRVVNGVLQEQNIVKDTPLPNQAITTESPFYLNWVAKVETGNSTDSFNVSVLQEDSLSIGLFLGSVFDIRGTESDLDSVILATRNISQVLENVATGMTNAVRSSANATSTYGVALTNVTFIHVRWAWLVPLIAMVALSAILLAATIVLNCINHVDLWRSSSLAFLFHGLEGWTADELDTTQQASMEEKAKKMRGKLVKNDDGRLNILRS